MATQYTPKRAQRTQAKLRLALSGPPNAGKTFTALLLAQELARPPQGARCFILVVDTERGSSQKYAGDADMPDFDVIELERFSPDEYLGAIREAAKGGYDVLIIDSLSHAWTGIGGVLEIVDHVTAKSKSQNPFTEGWRTASPLHAKLIDGILQTPTHVICTMRSKTEYVMQEVNGRRQPKEMGTEAVQRRDLAYEFDIVGEMDKENTLVVTKTRCRALNGAVFAKPGADLAQIIQTWLSEGAPAVVDHAQASARGEGLADPAQVDLILKIVAALKQRYPGEDATSKQDRSDMAQEVFGVPAIVAQLKKLPLATLQARYARLGRPAPHPTVEAPDHEGFEDVPDPPAARPAVEGSRVVGMEPLDDESATEALCLQLERFAERQGMVPAYQGLLQAYDVYRLEDGVLVLTGEERQELYGKAQGLWPEMSPLDVQVF